MFGVAYSDTLLPKYRTKRDTAQKEYDEAVAAVGEDVSEEELLKNDNVKKAKEELDEA